MRLAFFQRAKISNSRFVCGRALRFAGEDRSKNVL